MTDRSSLDDALRWFLTDMLRHGGIGLWELTWEAAGAVGGDPHDLVAWAKSVLAHLIRLGQIEIALTSWPALDPLGPLRAADLIRLWTDDDAWCAPDRTDLLVVVRAPDRDTRR